MSAEQFMKPDMTDDELKAALKEAKKFRDQKYVELCDARHQYDEQVMYGNVVGLRMFGFQTTSAVREAECRWLRAQTDVDTIRHCILKRRTEK